MINDDELKELAEEVDRCLNAQPPAWLMFALILALIIAFK